MTYAKKFALSSVIVALAAVAAMAMMFNSANALSDLFIPGSNSIHVGDTTTVQAEAHYGSGFGHAVFTINSSGPGGGAAVFTANGATQLICRDNNVGGPAVGVFGDCDVDPDWDEIEVEVQGTAPGSVQICAEGFESESNGGDHTNGQNPRCVVLSVTGSGGGILTLSDSATSIGLPNAVAGWDFAIGDGRSTLITAKLTDNFGNPVPNMDIDFATVAQAGTLEGGVEPFNLQMADDNGGPVGTWTHGFQDCETDSAGTCSVWARTIDTTPYGSHLITAVSEWPFFAANTIQIIVAKAPSNVDWDLDDPQGAATQQDVTLTVTDEDGRKAWTNLDVYYDSGAGSFGWLACPQGATIDHAGTAGCWYLSDTVTGPAILGVNIGGLLPATKQIQIISGATPPSGAFNPVPVAGGLTITSYTGTEAALEADGDKLDLVSCAATVGGNFIVHIFGAPEFVNQAFHNQFGESGLDNQGLICRRA